MSVVMQKYLYIAWVEAKLWSAYKFSMMLSLITGPLRLIVNYFVWLSVYAFTPGQIIAGRTFEQMILYIFIANLLRYIIWDDASKTLAHHVQNGSLVRFLLRPISYWRIQFIRKFGNRSLAFFIENIPVSIIFILLVKINPFVYVQNLLLLILSLGMAFAISYFYGILLGSIAFWTEKGDNLVRFAHALELLFLGIIFPLDLYPVFIQKILFFLPFQFLVYIPTQVYLGEYTFGAVSLPLWAILVYQFIYMIILFFIMKLVWKLGVKRFGAVGG